MKAISVLLALLLLITFPLQDEEKEPGSRSLSFIDIGETAFDSTSAPRFISAADWNNDGYDDLLFNGHRLFKNSGPPDFDFTLMGSVFNGTVSGSSNGVWADWDGDGDQDLYQGCGKGTPDRFWENQGAPDYLLEDVSSSVFGDFTNTGPNTGNAWCDFDMDGDLDIYVGNGEDWNDGDPVYYEDFLLRNDEGTGFTDLSAAAGIRTGENFYSRGATWGDHDNDRWNDLYVSHYRIRENHLFVNDGDGTFTEMGVEKNCSGTYDTRWYEDTTAGGIYGQTMWGPTWGHTIGSSWADFNRDGNLDLWTSDFVHKYVGYINSWYDIRGYVCDDGNLYINDGAPYYTFTDYRNTSKIPIWPVGGQGVYQGDQTFSGVSIGDIDNDGWEDMYIPQVYGNLPYTTPHLFRNKGFVADGSVPNGTTFEDITDQMGIEGANTYACLFFDRDNDGDLDIVTGGADTWDGSDWGNYRVRLYDNQGTGDNRYIKVKLNGTGMNRDAIGARVTIRFQGPMDDKQIMTREVRAGTGHAHQQSNVLHFGLGTEIDPEAMDLFQIEIRWPDGNIQRVKVDEADTTIYVDQPTSGNYPVVNSVSITNDEPDEDESVYISLDVDQGSHPITYYLWDLDLDNHFDDVTTDSNIDFIPRTGGFHQVRCFVLSSSDGGDNVYVAEVYPIEFEVNNVIPVVSIEPVSGDMDSRIRALTYSIHDTASDLRNLTWNLSWGDGSFDDGKGTSLPVHTYTSPGEFSIILSVSDEQFTVEKETTATISNVDPWGWIEVLPPGKKNFTEDIWVEFHPHVSDTPSDDSGHVITWIHEGERKKGELNVSLFSKFHDPGNETLYLEITDRYGGTTTVSETIHIKNLPPRITLMEGRDGSLSGVEDERLRFDMLEAFDNETDMLSGFNFSWDFGDGNVSSVGNDPLAYHTYERAGNYNAVCKVEDDNGALADYVIDVNIDNVPPEIYETGIDSEYMEEEVIRINEAMISDTPSDKDLLYLSVESNGPCGTDHSGDAPRIWFYDTGEFDIWLTVTDDDGASATLSRKVTINNLAPSGSISPLNGSYDEDEPFRVKSIDLHDTPGDLKNLTVEWKIDDEPVEGSGTSMEVMFEKSGTRRITMTISDGDSTTHVERFVRIRNPVPIASFAISGNNETYILGDGIRFDASETSDNPSDIGSLEYFWDMDDGTMLYGKVIDHSFNTSGTHLITLTVTDDDGDYDVFRREIEIIEVDDERTDPGTDDNNGTGTLLVILLSAVALAALAVLIVVLVLKRSRTENKTGPIPTPQQQNAMVQSRSRGMMDRASPEQLSSEENKSQQGFAEPDRNRWNSTDLPSGSLQKK